MKPEDKVVCSITSIAISHSNICAIYRFFRQNSELLTFTYGAIVMQLIKDYKVSAWRYWFLLSAHTMIYCWTVLLPFFYVAFQDVEVVNLELEKMSLATIFFFFIRMNVFVYCYESVQ